MGAHTHVLLHLGRARRCGRNLDPPPEGPRRRIAA
jgi:hypothetical protein